MPACPACCFFFFLGAMPQQSRSATRCAPLQRNVVAAALCDAAWRNYAAFAGRRRECYGDAYEDSVQRLPRACVRSLTPADAPPPPPFCRFLLDRQHYLRPAHAQRRVRATACHFLKCCCADAAAAMPPARRARRNAAMSAAASAARVTRAARLRAMLMSTRHVRPPYEELPA